MRRKSRRDRRPGLPIESRLAFYPRYAVETVVKLVRWGALYLRLRRIYLAIKHDPRRFEYTDLAMTAVADDESDTHDLFDTDAARAYVAQAKRIKQAQDGHAHAEDRDGGGGVIIAETRQQRLRPQQMRAGRTSCRRCRRCRRRAWRQMPQ